MLDPLYEYLRSLCHSPSHVTRREALVGDVCEAMENRFPEGFEAELDGTILGECFEEFLRTLTGELLARVTPILVVLKQGADLTKTKSRPRGLRST